MQTSHAKWVEVHSNAEEIVKSQGPAAKLPERLELLHKLLVAYAVNLPMFVTRMITWHGLSQGISIFALKNLIAMGVTAFEVLEHRFTHSKTKKETNGRKNDYPLESRNSNV